MVHGYHVIMPMYGFWLPNDPRGSWSDFVRRWELVRFGRSNKSLHKRDLSELTAEERNNRQLAQDQLLYPRVSIDGQQALGIAHGFSDHVHRNNYTVWACAILPEHTHLVLARHRFSVEQMVNLLKGASTRALLASGQHPLGLYRTPRGQVPCMWSARRWKVFLDSEEAIDQAIRYVEENPVKEGKKQQHWSFVTPFAGIDRHAWSTYH